ncbi:MAG: LLM class F420-dependent oxidoreductase [Dehalococcoidia bacterium]
MKLGTVFSHPQMGNDPAAWKDFAQAVEGAGFNHIVAAEHVAGGHPDRLAGVRVHTYEEVYHDPFVLFSYLAGVTSTIEFGTAILILPQRQTFVVAKQAADLDIVSNGRLRIGVGSGRNWMEYEVLGVPFEDRGRRMEEQVEVLRRLWTEELVTYKGRYHDIDRMGINPLPVQRPIPIWMGSFTQVVEHVVKRIARVADGWIPQFPPNDDFRALMERFRGYAREAGRNPDDIAIECGARITTDEDPEGWLSTAQAYKDIGATHLRCFVTGDVSIQQRIDLLTKWRETVAGV